MRKILTAVAVAAITTLAAPAAGVQAAIAPVRPVQVVLSGPATTVQLTAVSDKPTTARGGHGGELCFPMTGRRSACGESWSDSESILFTIPIRSADLILGTQRWEFEDYGDSKVTGLSVTVLRASRLSAGPIRSLGVRGGGVVGGSAVVTHYDPSRTSWTGSPGSPIWVQVAVGSSWRTVATWTTDPTGLAYGTARVGTGTQRVRLVRPDGARDASVTGPVVMTTA